MRAQATLQAPVRSRRLKLQAMLCLPVRAGLNQSSMKVAVLGTTDYTRSSHGRMGWFLAVPKKRDNRRWNEIKIWTALHPASCVPPGAYFNRFHCIVHFSLRYFQRCPLP
jgi:hypothetical protein